MLVTKKTMKIIFLISSKGNGGMEKIIEKVSCYMNRKGHEIIYLNLYTPQEYEYIKKTGVFWPPFNNTINKTYIKCAEEYPTKKPFLKIVLNWILGKEKYYGLKKIIEVIENEKTLTLYL